MAMSFSLGASLSLSFPLPHSTPQPAFHCRHCTLFQHAALQTNTLRSWLRCSCGDYDNSAGIMTVDEHLTCSFQVLKPADGRHGQANKRGRLPVNGRA